MSAAEAAEWCFLETTYYLHLLALLFWIGTYLRNVREPRTGALVAWLGENWPGLLVALAVTTVAALAVEPALRVLSDEANLVGTSKNLFASRTPTFTVSGKSYYGSYWDIDAAIDQRPTLFPFCVSLVHAVLGYSYENVFRFNLLVLAGLLFTSYRLAKSAGGETFGVVAALFVAAHPVTLMSARSGGFDLFATFLGVLVLESTLGALREPAPGKVAIVWMNLCLFASSRYETALFVPPLVVLLAAFKTLTMKSVRPYAFVYALTPLFVLPRLLQALLRGSVPAQEPGTVTFSAENFLNNAREYFEPVLPPFASSGAHSAWLVALGVAGAARWVLSLHRHARARDWQGAPQRFGLVVLVWMTLQTVIVFTYYWGRAQFPSAARLVIPIDTFFSFAAAWLVVSWLERWGRAVPLLLAAGTLVTAVPVAAQHRMMNRLTQTRESERTWRFFRELSEERLLIVTDRPNHFTIMGYGAMSFEAARRDQYLFTAHARHLFHDVYVIQQIQLSTGEPRPGYAIWPERKLDTVLEFQNDADVLVRVSRLAR